MNICELKYDDWRKLKALLINSSKESPDAFSAIVDENTPDHEFKGWAKKWSRGSNNATINQATDAKLNQAIDSHEDQHNNPQKKTYPAWR